VKPPLDVAAWPLDGTQWIAKTAEALTVAGVDAEAVQQFTLRASAGRTVDWVMCYCVGALSAYYIVTGGPA